jgi:hypothetical protein
MREHSTLLQSSQWAILICGCRLVLYFFFAFASTLHCPWKDQRVSPAESFNNIVWLPSADGVAEAAYGVHKRQLKAAAHAVALLSNSY